MPDGASDTWPQMPQHCSMSGDHLHAANTSWVLAHFCLHLVCVATKAPVVLQDLGLKYVRLDGSTAVADRLTIVDSCVSCLLLSLWKSPDMIAAPAVCFDAAAV